MINRILRCCLLISVAVIATDRAEASTTICGTVPAIAATSHEWITSLGTNCTFSQSQPTVGDLANVAAGTVLGNATGSSAAPTATAAPVLGVASTTSGTLGLYSSGTANKITIQNVGATAAYNFNLPNTVGSSGQVLTSAGGGGSAMTWSTLATAALTVSSQTTAFNVTAAADATRYDNTGAAGSIIGTLPASPTAGDNWCFLVSAAQTLEVLANTGETINFGGTVSASAGNIQSSTVGSSACLYFESATVAYIWGSTGTWSVT